MNKKMQSALSSIETAKNWEAKRQPAWVVRCLSSALMNYLSVAVCEMREMDAALVWLKQNETDKLLAKCSSNFEVVLSEVEKGKLPASVLGGGYSHIVFSHLSWLMGLPDVGRFFVSLGSKAEIQKISTPFWAEYAKALHALISGTKTTIILGDLSGQEKYWASYVSLMNAFMVGDDLREAIKVVDDSFIARNRDTSIFDDSYEIEGTARCPALWDFRKEALLLVVRQIS